MLCLEKDKADLISTIARINLEVVCSLLGNQWALGVVHVNNDSNQQQAIKSEKNQILILHNLRPLLIILLMSCGVFHIRSNLTCSFKIRSYGVSKMEDCKFIRILPSQVMLVYKCLYACRHGSLLCTLLSSPFELVQINLLHSELQWDTTKCQ